MSEVVVGLALLAVGSALGAALAKNNSNWFMSLLQSKFTPPRHLFRVMWPMCYVSLAAAVLCLSWSEPSSIFWDTPLVFSFFVQSILNITYPVLFFHYKRLDWALWNILALSISSVMCTWYFYNSGAPWTAILSLPYAAWVIFLTILNADFYRIKRGQESNPFLYKQKYSPHSLYVNPKLTETGKFYSQVPPNPMEEDQLLNDKKSL